MLFYVQIMTYLAIQRKFNYKLALFNNLFLYNFSMKLFVRGSGARYEGPRHIESLETFYREKLAEDANVC